MIAVGVDVGGSGVRAHVVEAGQRRSARRVTALPRADGRIAVDQLADLVVQSVLEARTDSPVERPLIVCVGMTGLPELLDEPESLARAIGDALEADRVVLASDAVTAHIGALEFGRGTVIAAGTGVVALGTDFGDIWNRTDGWGVLLGDEGGGAWIGRRGLVSALRATDGRIGGSSDLRERMHRHFGAPDHVVSSVYGSSTPSYLLGGFAPEVAEAARAGDPAARGIWEEAGTLLASAASAASAGLEPVFSWSGRLFDAGELLLDPFRHALLALHPDAELVHPLGSSTDGALLIAARERIAGSAAPASFIASYDMNTAPAGGARHSAAMASGAKGTRSASTSARNSSSESPSSR